MAGFALILIGMAVMLVTPLQRVTAGRRERPHISVSLRVAYPPVRGDGFPDSLPDGGEIA